MKKCLSVILIFFCVNAELLAQINFKNAFIVDFTLGLNSPYKNLSVGNSTYNVYDDLGPPTELRRSISASNLFPPMSFGADFMLTDRISIGMSAIHQSHRENWSLSKVATNEILEYHTERKSVSTLLIHVRGIWLMRDNFHLGSGVGFGRCIMKSTGHSPYEKTANSIDIQLLNARYEICCNWFLNFMVRTTQTIDDVTMDIGYNVGLGVSYAFKSR